MRRMLTLRRQILPGLLLLALINLINACGIEHRMIFYPSSAIESTPRQTGLEFEDIFFTTRDGVRLNGWLVPHSDASSTLIWFHGNAGNISHRVENIKLLHDLVKVNIFIFDYRGYGNSEGKPRLKAIVSDYRELFDYVGTVAPGKRLLYGISFGGVVLLNVIGSDIVFDRAVIDSSPGYVSHLGCPHDYDPAENFPKNASGMLVIAGTQDTVVSPADSRALIDLAQARGGRAEVRAEYAHPFMDSDSRVHRERLEMIQTFLTGVSSAR